MVHEDGIFRKMHRKNSSNKIKKKQNKKKTNFNSQCCMAHTNTQIIKKYVNCFYISKYKIPLIVVTFTTESTF